ncbi:2-succinyl-5-enolpyruvyl-6-hydroxy-3-cyclohexene-1-carboxylic-acid synthase [Ectothiorhodospira mobilis]|uniref:2-succinyl-5-enolpyruvyl-6-hydroxy-3- cyclohexene-1-carboxylic-acid synthase n=1 Tax=Ectothiorhodospira mobilis TaxID=195064 RepID=UPI001EE7A2ED|nr:2-succinyl-5-enolpyruvyl-6-hydroxy-3-cyclohexene-1-carboxylic-acid synthase [Ectothiorhodospira mobilis]MCG5536787.1 2-succinyl-5-enolpyruvyl-6-hydroxy-3-cyclohexene-1-carboxylic-acid synthase [Ectothiorhodospira mobilis]
MRAPFSHINEAWSRLILERLYDHGVRDLCIAPGSRSAPLTLAAANLQRPDLALHTHFDERGLGFLALGLAKARGRPVALITTSGTAVPNLHPSLVEAFQTHVPLVAVTADRPPELLHCGANQAIEQSGLFAHHVRAAADLPPADEAVSAGWLSQALDRACAALHGPDRGPVHINAPFRDPLYGTSQRADFGPWRSDVRPVPEMPPSAPATARPETPPQTPALLVAGQLLPEEARAVLRLAECTGTPVLADIGSQLRLLDHPRILPYAELWLATPAGRCALAGIRQVIQFGGRLTGKRLNQWLAGFEGEHWLVSEHSDHLDPQRRARHVQAPIPDFCDALSLPPSPPLETAEPTVNACLEATLEARFSELTAVRLITQRLPRGMALLPGNSMSVRLLDLVAAPGDGNPVLTNRGASGIDGLVATAAGYARHHGAGVTLVLGDLSLLHDLNSLHLAARSPSPLVILALNNDGGAIFQLLPARDQGPHFAPFFQLPHGLDFAQAAAQFGLDYARPDTPEALAATYDAACARTGATLIELCFPPHHGADHLNLLLQRLQETGNG